MTVVQLKLHEDERRLREAESGELTDIEMALATGLGLSTILIVYMIIYFAMGLSK